MQGQEHNVLSLRTHHSIMDGSSLQVLTEDLEAAYTSLNEHQVTMEVGLALPPPPPLPPAFLCQRRSSLQHCASELLLTLQLRSSNSWLSQPDRAKQAQIECCLSNILCGWKNGDVCRPQASASRGRKRDDHLLLVLPHRLCIHEQISKVSLQAIVHIHEIVGCRAGSKNSPTGGAHIKLYAQRTPAPP